MFRSIISNLFLALAVLLLAGPAYQAAVWLLEPEAEAVASAEVDSSATRPAEALLTADIQHIRVGQRVLADDPDVEVSTRTRVDPETWKRVTLESIWHWPDGTRDDVRVVTLVPPEWLAAFEVEVGREAPLPLDLVEMGLPETLTAKVLAIERCPPLADGQGRVVLTTVNHLHCDVHTLTLRDATGRERTVHPTGGHRFYRARDRAWVHLRDLRVGDELGGLDAPVTVADIAPLPGAHRVYNLTVEGEHVYYVSQLAALAHNNGCAINPALAARLNAWRDYKAVNPGAKMADWVKAKSTESGFLSWSRRVAPRTFRPNSVRVPEGHSRVYRAVSEAEYQDILSSGRLRQGPNSMEGKWFAGSLDGAQAHGKALFPDGYRLIEVDIPKNAPSFHFDPNLDLRGPAYYLDGPDLPTLTPRPLQ